MSYQAAVSYDSGPISLLDRNILRIAKNYDGSMCGDSFEYGKDRQYRGKKRKHGQARYKRG